MALIRSRGGDIGLKHYLETGQKIGREETREQLDKRLFIDGNLSIADYYAHAVPGEAECYHHITVGFAETNVSEEILKAYTADLKEFLLDGFAKDEVYFYAEAHIPRTQTRVDEKNNPIIRLPHLHIAIPKINLVTGKPLSIFGLERVAYGTNVTTWDLIKAKQEQLNAKYGLKSPDESRRLNLMSEIERINKYPNKIESHDFAGSTTKSKLLEIQDLMIAQRVETPEQFRAMLEKIAKVSIGSKGKPTEHLVLKFPDEKKGVRLYPHKHYQFTEEFIRLPTAVKQKMLADASERAELLKRSEPGDERKTTLEYLKTLEIQWQRKREIRYIHMGTSLWHDTYRNASSEQKLAILKKLEDRHFAQLKTVHGYDHQTGQFLINDRSLKNASKNLGDFNQFDRFAPRPERSASGELLYNVRGWDVAGQDSVHQEEFDLLLSGDALGDMAHDERDGLRHPDGRSAGISLFPSAGSQIDPAQLTPAALARIMSYQDALDVSRSDGRSRKTIAKVYGRSVEELQAAANRGNDIILNPAKALAELTFSQSVFTARELEKYLITNTADHHQYSQALAAVLASNELVARPQANGKEVFTTESIVNIEHSLVLRSKEMGQKKLKGVSATEQARLIKSMTMNHGQEAAFKLLCSEAQLAVVNGAPGTGKSYILKAMRQAYEAEGYKVLGAILQGKTAEDLERDSGIKSSTLHSTLARIKDGKLKLDSKTVIVVDEAGMVGSRQLEELLGHAQKAGAKVRLVGDVRQLSAVEYGNAFAEVSSRCSVASLTDIQRQKEAWMKAASEQLSIHHIEQGLSAYAERGHVHQSDTQADAEDAIVKSWAAARTAAPGQSMLVLVATNAERVSLNNKMRAVLKSGGGLEGGLIVETERGFREISTGESIMFTESDYSLGVKNGTTGRVLKIEDRVLHVQLDGGAVVKVDTKAANPAIDYAYAVTVHKSQGMTVDRAWLLASLYMTAESLLVAMTRHRHALEVHFSAEKFPAPGAEKGDEPDFSASLEVLKKNLGRAGRKEFSHDENAVEAWQTTRQNDSVVSQLKAELAAEKYIESVSKRADFRELRDNLDAARVLDHVVKSHGVVASRYSIIKDSEGRDRIVCGKKHLNVSDFLTKELNLDFKEQALPILKTAYARQNEGAYLALHDASLRGQEPKATKPLWKDFIQYREANAQAYKEATAAIREVQKIARATAKARSAEEVRAIKAKFTGDLLKQRLAEHKTTESAIAKTHREAIAAKKAAIASAYKKPQAEQYKDYLEKMAMQGKPEAVAEFKRVAFSDADNQRLAKLVESLQSKTEQKVTAQEELAQKQTAQELAERKALEKELAKIDKQIEVVKQEVAQKQKRSKGRGF